MLNMTLTDPHSVVTLLIHYLCRSFDRSLFHSAVLLNRSHVHITVLILHRHLIIM